MTAVASAAYVRPASPADALRARAAHPAWVVVAGGTDLMVPGERATEPPGVLDLFGLEELHEITLRNGCVRIGACATYGELLSSALIRVGLPLLHAAAAQVGEMQIRERGTIGGNVVASSPVGDLLPGLLALDATMRVASIAADRAVPYEQFLTGYRQVDLAADELLIAVDVPVPAACTVQHWRKVATSDALVVSTVSLAAVARLDGDRARKVRLAYGGMAEQPLRLHDVEVLVEGARLGPALAAAAGAAVTESVEPITDARSTADDRLGVAARLTERFVLALAERRDGSDEAR